MTSQDVSINYGFTAVPADQTQTPPATKTPKPVTVNEIPLPNTPLANRINNYVKAKLPSKTYLHSLRVYSYGCAIARQCYPDYNLISGGPLDETWFLTAMLHDIGTCPGHIDNTRLSYEFWAGYHALDILQNPSSTGSAGGDASGVASRDQAESVAEAIIRHQDVQDKGTITLMTRLIHMGTLLDNIGAGKELVHRDTIRAVNNAYDRKDWSSCFASTVKQEKELKPYAMVTRIEGFEDAIEENGKTLMQEWDRSNYTRVAGDRGFTIRYNNGQRVPRVAPMQA